MLSAARTLVAGGVAGSTITFPNVDTAALHICCNRATDCMNAIRRAARKPASKSGSFSHLYSVRAPTLTALAASSVLRLVRSAMIASSCLWVSFSVEPAISCHPLPGDTRNLEVIAIAGSGQNCLAFHANQSDPCDRGRHRHRRKRDYSECRTDPDDRNGSRRAAESHE